ncbi:MAG: GH92 family glycosyl hydrolase [Bacteroidia bacterium]
MKFYFLPLLFFVTFFISGCGDKNVTQHVPFSWNVDASKTDFAKYVNPMIGTAGHGHTFPGATAPFGMVQLSPDTRVDGSWDGCSGYHYDDSVIYGFSHTHLSGTGCSDYGDFLFMPGNSDLMFDNDPDKKYNYTSLFLHKNEHAEAGYYSVLLDKYKIKAELTASPRVGIHRYSFPSSDSNWIILDLMHRDEVVNAKIKILSDHSIEGFRESKAWANDQKLYFYAEFSESFESVPNQMRKGKWEETDSLTGKMVQVAFKFSGTKQVIIKVALSPVSCENAKQNMQVEVPDFDFDAVHKKVVQQWNNELGKIEVKTADETKKKIFYTALYHCFIAPNLYCDVNGDYRGMDNQIHTDTIHPQYTVFSLWDTHRALHPLFTIIQPKRDQDFINTFIKQYKEGGLLPVWELSANETNCMIGYHAVPVIVDAWMKGLTNFDTAVAYEAMKKSAMQDKNGLAAYKKYGFIPAEGESESVSKTLEYAYDDWCIALVAKRMKRDDDYNYFMRRSQSWRNLYDPETGFFRPRLNNSFVQPFDPGEVNFHFTEANAWQYSLAVQQDIPGLIKAHGGDRKFIEHLDKLFSASSKTSGREQADITGLIGQYAQGNEPSHHVAYLYNYTSEPWKTQEMISKICNEMYTDKPDGLCGNEDCGQMSAWYVFSSIGFYPVTPGTNEFSIGSPQFDEVIFHLENGKDFVVEAKNYSPSNPFIHSWILNDYITEDLPQFSYANLVNGKSLRFKMGNAREITYAIPAFNGNEYPDIPGVPIVLNATNHLSPSGHSAASDRTFNKHMELLMTCNEKYFVSVNNGEFIKYSPEGHIDLYETSTLRAFSQNESGVCSDTVEFRYFKIPFDRSIKLNSTYANQYAAGGDQALIDGIRGSDNFRTGSWQGYEGKDIDAVIDLGAVKEISKITLGCLQDQGSWIFLPYEVIFYSSMDGENFTEIGKDKNTIPQNTSVATLHDFSIVKPTKARYIKVVARNSGLCPQWHPGKGSPSWLFADEIVIE